MLIISITLLYRRSFVEKGREREHRIIIEHLYMNLNFRNISRFRGIYPSAEIVELISQPRSSCIHVNC